MRGEGIKEIMKKIGTVLGPIAKEVGSKVLKEIIIPLIIKEGKKRTGLSEGSGSEGSGLGVAGGALKLAGQGKKKKYVKGSAAMKEKMAKLRAMRKK
jgi:hypothetical protein